MCECLSLLHGIYYASKCHNWHGTKTHLHRQNLLKPIYILKPIIKSKHQLVQRQVIGTATPSGSNDTGPNARGNRVSR